MYFIQRFAAVLNVEPLWQVIQPILPCLATVCLERFADDMGLCVLSILLMRQNCVVSDTTYKERLSNMNLLVRPQLRNNDKI